MKPIGSQLALGFGAFLHWFWQFHVGSSVSSEVSDSSCTVGLRVIRLKHEPWKSIKSSCCGHWQVVFLFNLVKSPAALFSTFKPQHSKGNLSVVCKVHALLGCDELQEISFVNYVTAIGAAKQTEQVSLRLKDTQTALMQLEAIWNVIFMHSCFLTRN